MASIISRAFPSWPTYPIAKSLSLSGSGILALADLTTTAKRTALTGTSSWFDIFVLAPGLHIQQAAESMGTANKSGALPTITSHTSGDVSKVTNSATIHYLERIYENDNGDRRTITVDVGSGSWKPGSYGAGRRSAGPRGQILRYENPPTSHISNALYALGPLLTLVAVIIMILAQDWWGLSTLLWLMIARALNVWVIQQRTADVPPVSKTRNVHVCWCVNLDDDRWLCLRGLRHDLEAITTGSWMRAKTHVEGYLEACAKLIVYLVAVFSGNLTQTGDIVLMALLLTSGALLALSNSYSRTFHMNGKTACHHGPAETDDSLDGGVGNGTGDDGRGYDGPAPSYEEGEGTVVSDFEKQEMRTVYHSTYPFNDEVNYV